jgi:hypothetical protein
MNGILWLPKTEEIDFSLFKNYKSSLNNYLRSNLVEINNYEQIPNMQNIFVIDEHYFPHREFILNEKFVQETNNNKVRLIIFNTEKIYNQPFKHNIEIQNQLNKFNDYVQFLSDAQDIKKLKPPFATKQLFTKDFDFQKYKSAEKKEELLFIGQTDGRAYKNRRAILKNISKFVNIPLEVIETKRKLSYDEFLSTISNYKFLLNPLGNGVSRFLNVRFYEAVGLKTIPVQEIRNDMKELNEELEFSNVIYFRNLRTLKKVDFKKVVYQQNESLEINTLEEYFSKKVLINFLK